MRWKRFDPLKKEDIIVPQRNGGGYRFIMLNENESFSSLKEKSTELYFPEGKNFFDENLNECSTSMTDASDQPLDDTLSMKDYLTQNGIYISKTYFIFHSKTNNFSLDYIGDIDICHNCKNAKFGDQCFICMDLPQSCSAAPASEVSTMEEVQQILTAEESSSNTFNAVNSDAVTIPVAAISDVKETVEVQQSLTAEESSSNTADDFNSESDTIPVVAISDDEQTVEVNPSLTSEELSSKKQITVHRLRMKEDIIESFKSVTLTDIVRFKIIDPTGKTEDGVGVGVLRDIYTSVWEEMFDSLCIGAGERVPFVRHDLYFDEWNSLGNVLLKGFTSCRFFPIKLAKAFVIHCLFGQVPNDVLLDSFLNYVSVTEAEVINVALKGRR